MWVCDIRVVATNQARVFLRKKIIQWIKKVDLFDKSVWDNGFIEKDFLPIDQSFIFLRRLKKNFKKNLLKT